MNPLCDPFPTELNDPVTAWPYLRKRFPWLFDDQKEVAPAAPQIDVERVYDDLLVIAQHFTPKELTLADISEILTNERYYSGSTYKRVKDVYDLLFSSSPVESEPVEGEVFLLKAA